MNIALAEKLIKLIQTSEFLNEAERREWLTLLELMNDKQMLELERILSPKPQVKSSPTPQVNTTTLAPAPTKLAGLPQINQQTSLSKPLSQNLPHKNQDAQSLHLSHILNLPRLRGSNHSSVADARLHGQNKSSVGLTKAPTIRPLSGFAQKLKNMLREPELPEGHQTFELELEAPKQEISRPIFVEKKSAEQLVKKEPPKVPQPPRREPQNEKKQDQPKFKPGMMLSHTLQQAQPKPILASKPVQVQNPVETPALPQIKPTQRNPEVLPAQYQPKTGQDEPVSLADALLQHKLSEADKRHKAGLGNWPKFYDLAAQKKPAPASQAQILPKNSLGNIPFAASAHINVRALIDLEKLEITSLHAPGNEFEIQLKNLVKQFGFPEVVVHMEKSPLYAKYINTGSEMLRKSANFSSTMPEEGQLSRQEFEKFTDTLRTVQAE